MGTWFKKEVGDSDTVVGKRLSIHKTFLLSQGKDISQVAVFSESESHSGEASITLYFTPEAESLAQGLAASPCDKPEYNVNFTLLVGDVGVWDTYFPEHLSQTSD